MWHRLGELNDAFHESDNGLPPRVGAGQGDTGDEPGVTVRIRQTSSRYGLRGRR